MSAVLAPRVDLVVGSELDVRQVVSAVARFCSQQGFAPAFAAHVATAASELSNNLWMHADGGGRLAVARLEGATGPGVELTAVDRGPGIADVAQALLEGYSTAGGLGCGLPGVRRLMDDFEIDSAPGRGTRVVARKWQRR